MNNSSPSRTDQRIVRVFISSTFKDMQAEREELLKFTFPELRQRCRERRVEFVGVDLRWGITDEKKAEGRVIPICLAEIEGCRPYFIGLLGERYGWVPEHIDDELVDFQPWLKEHKEKSVTELEILHGVLNDPEMKGLAFFYIRKKETSDIIEQLLSKEPGYVPEPKTSRTKLAILKERIKARSYPLKKDFPDAKTLGWLVLEDLWSAIDKRYPLEEVPSELEQRRMEHDAFASLRTKVYIGEKEYFDRLNNHIASEGPPLVLLGESGSGKSALLANWVKEYRESHPKAFLVCHYIGSTPDSADYVHMLRHIMEEIKERCNPDIKDKEDSVLSIMGISAALGIENEIPTDPKKLIEAFPIWLARATVMGKFILILDGLNQLEDRDNAPDLVWLPWKFSANVRLILSTLPGRSLKALKKRNWHELNVWPMGKDEQKKYIIEYLRIYRKELSTHQIETIIKEEQASNPLYLKTLLEELRVFGIHEELNRRIEHYLQATSVDGLFNLVLERLERDYERERDGLVREVTTLIWASRKGLSESELLELLGSKETPIPRAHFSPLYLALEESLVSRSGLLTFFHDFLKKAVETRYLPNNELKQKAHLTISDYFGKRDIDHRKIDEMPWQLCRAESWQRLMTCITDMDFFINFMTETKRYELTGYWLSMATRYDMVDKYHEMIELYEKTSPDLSELGFKIMDTAIFLDLNAKYHGAEPLYRKALAVCEKVFGAEHPETAVCLNNLALLLDKKGDYRNAETLYRRSLAVCEKVFGPEHYIITGILNNLALLLKMKHELHEAESLYRRGIIIRENINGIEHSNLAMLLNNFASLLNTKGDYQGAESFFRRALSIAEKKLSPEHPVTAQSLNGLAGVLKRKRDFQGAEPLYRKALAIAEKILGPEQPLTAQILSGLANLLEEKRDFQGAEPLYRRALVVSQKVFGSEHPDTAVSLHNLALFLKKKGDTSPEAELLYGSALDISEKVLGPNHPLTQTIKRHLNSLLKQKKKSKWKFWK